MGNKKPVNMESPLKIQRWGINRDCIRMFRRKGRGEGREKRPT